MKKSNFCLVVILSLMVFSGVANAGAGNGLVGKYYAYVDLAWEGPGPYPDNVWSATYDDADLAFTRIDPNIQFFFGEPNWWCTEPACPPHIYVAWSPIDQGLNDQYAHLCTDPYGFPYEVHWKNECFGVIWTGYIEIAETGWYSFATVSDDGASVRIGDDLIIDGHRNWFTPIAASIHLEAGYHAIEVRYWEMTRWDGIRLDWSTDGEVTWDVVPHEVFYPAEPCDANSEWQNHGQYVRCVAHYANSLLESGYVTQEEADTIVSEAAQTEIGK